MRHWGTLDIAHALWLREIKPAQQRTSEAVRHFALQT
jgi:hypothetical protein